VGAALIAPAAKINNATATAHRGIPQAVIARALCLSRLRVSPDRRPEAGRGSEAVRMISADTSKGELKLSCRRASQADGRHLLRLNIASSQSEP
jgi:hypothetical protein